MLSVGSVCCDSLSANIRFTFIQCDSGMSYSAGFCIYKADTLIICRVDKKGAPNLFLVQVRRSQFMRVTGWFVLYSVAARHSNTSLSPKDKNGRWRFYPSPPIRVDYFVFAHFPLHYAFTATLYHFLPCKICRTVAEFKKYLFLCRVNGFLSRKGR